MGADEREPMLFVTQDRALLTGGVLHATDRKILDDARRGGGGELRIVTPEEALRLADEEAASGKPKPKPKPRGPSMPGFAKMTAPGLLELSKADLQDMAEGAGERRNLFLEISRVQMDDRFAREVRQVRVEQNWSWRCIAELAAKKWRTGWGSNQIAGMAVCEVAASSLGEDYMESPWN